MRSLLLIGGCLSVSGFIHGLIRQSLVPKSAAVGVERAEPSRAPILGARFNRRRLPLSGAGKAAALAGDRRAHVKVNKTSRTLVMSKEICCRPWCREILVCSSHVIVGNDLWFLSYVFAETWSHSECCRIALRSLWQYTAVPSQIRYLFWDMDISRYCFRIGKEMYSIHPDNWLRRWLKLRVHWISEVSFQTLALGVWNFPCVHQKRSYVLNVSSRFCSKNNPKLQRMNIVDHRKHLEGEPSSLLQTLHMSC